LRQLAAEKRKEISLLAEVKAAEIKQKAISIADEKHSSSLSDNLDAITITEIDSSQKDVEKEKEKEKEKDRLTENTPEVRQEVTYPKAQSLSLHCCIVFIICTQ
jgi:hypothetical protein